MLRGIAALLVVLFHAAAIWRELSGGMGYFGPWDRGWAGVDLFFVISGFVMVWVAGDRPAGWRTAAQFLFDRATRIYPLWWVFCTMMALYFLFAYGQPASPTVTAEVGAWAAFAQSLSLWPTGQFPVLQVGWTLTFELAFYAVFAVLLLLPRPWRPYGLGLWAVLLLTSWAVSAPRAGLPSSPLALLLNPLCLEFLMGVAAATIVRRWALPGWGALWLAVVGTAAFLSAMVLEPAYDPDALDRFRTLRFGIPSALILLGLVGLERASRMRSPLALNALGDASYTLYLSHVLVILVLKRACEAAGLLTEPSALSMAGFMGLAALASIAAALILYRVLERPLLRISRAPLAKGGLAGQR